MIASSRKCASAPRRRSEDCGVRRRSVGRRSSPPLPTTRASTTTWPWPRRVSGSSTRRARSTRRPAASPPTARRSAATTSRSSSSAGPSRAAATSRPRLLLLRRSRPPRPPRPEPRRQSRLRSLPPAPLLPPRRPPAVSSRWGRTAGLPALAALLLAAPGAARAGDVAKVTIAAPMPARLDMTGLRKILVTSFRVDKEVVGVDLNKETVALLRKELTKKTNLVILDVEPPPLPEQPLKDLLANSGFWRRLGETYGADLIISGKVSYETADRSGFVTQDEISPVT